MFGEQNMRVRYLRTLEKIRSFLLSTMSREFLIFLFFVFVSFCFWLLQVLNDEYETELPIPDEKTQKSIVDIFNVYTARRDINEQLKAQIKDICPILIRGSLEE